MAKKRARPAKRIERMNLRALEIADQLASAQLSGFDEAVRKRVAKSKKPLVRLGWHFLTGAMKSKFSTDGVVYEVGKTYTANGKLELCHNGFHAFDDLEIAVEFWRLRIDYYGSDYGSVLCRVEIGGPFCSDPDDPHKFCGRTKRILWKLDCSTAFTASPKLIYANELAARIALEIVKDRYP